MLQRLILALTFGMGLCAPPNSADAAQIVLTSTAPYWTVGERDNDLSRACSLSDFGPLRLGELVARFTGAEGPALLDVAKGNGRNLHDPKRRAKANEDYFFRNAGTTSCEVLVGGRGRGRGAVRPATR
jgi:hypothetical protein